MIMTRPYVTPTLHDSMLELAILLKSQILRFQVGDGFTGGGGRAAEGAGD